MNEISSPQNASYRLWLGLTESKGIRKTGLALVSGTKLVDELRRGDPGRIEHILLPPKAEPIAGTFKQTRLSSQLFRSLDVIGTRSPLAVVHLQSVPQWTPDEPPRGLEVILALSDPANLGACLRSAEAFGARRVILTRECSSPFLPKAIRASAGSALRVNLAEAGPLKDLRCAPAYGLDMNGEDLRRTRLPRDLYLVLGEEGQGLPPELPLKALRIPMRPPVESLNATVAAAIALFSYLDTWDAPD